MATVATKAHTTVAFEPSVRLNGPRQQGLSTPGSIASVCRRDGSVREAGVICVYVTDVYICALKKRLLFQAWP